MFRSPKVSALPDARRRYIGGFREAGVASNQTGLRRDLYWSRNGSFAPSYDRMPFQFQ
jgi:hypothetical protein